VFSLSAYRARPIAPAERRTVPPSMRTSSGVLTCYPLVGSSNNCLEGLSPQKFAPSWACGAHRGLYLVDWQNINAECVRRSQELGKMHLHYARRPPEVANLLSGDPPPRKPPGLSLRVGSLTAPALLLAAIHEPRRRISILVYWMAEVRKATRGVARPYYCQPNPCHPLTRPYRKNPDRWCSVRNRS
jgi:hypothetical protein